MAKKWDKITLCSILALLAVGQAITLNVPELSADEAIGGVIGLDVFREALHGKWPSLNPVLPYLAPYDLWLNSLVSAAMGVLGQSEAVPAQLRIIPLLFFWIASLIFARELWHRSSSIALAYLTMVLTLPIAYVHARIAWAPAFLLSAMTLLWAEIMRITRTESPRWLVIATLSSLGLGVHPTMVFGCLAALLSGAPKILKALRRAPNKQIIKITLALGLALIIAYPVLKNLPPPVAAENGGGTRFIWELRALTNILTGQRPIAFHFGQDPTPVAGLIFFLGLTIFIFGKRWILLTKKMDVEILRHTLVQLSLTAVLVWLCYKNRRLDLEGNERYLLSLLPGWLWLSAEAFVSVFGDLPKPRRLSVLPTHSLINLLSVLALIQAARLGLVIHHNHSSQDSLRSATRWLGEKCPPDQCLAYAENYWNYWPIRFHSRDFIQINALGHNWKKVHEHPRRGRNLAGCWFENSNSIYRGAFMESAVFPGQHNRPGQVCFGGIEL